MLRNASEAAVVRLALEAGGVTPVSASAALQRIKHPSASPLDAARAMLDSLRIRGVLELNRTEEGFAFQPSDLVIAFLEAQNFNLRLMGLDDLVEEFGEYHGQHVAPGNPIQINMASYKAARNDQTRAQRQLWQCPSPWDYAKRIKDELND